MRRGTLRLGCRRGPPASATRPRPSSSARAELVELGVLAEQHGFDTVVVSDHYQPWRHEGGHAPFSLAWMSAVGERTERVLLGTSVLTPTFRYHPAVIAQAFATMGCLFPGRVMLGVGTGEAMNEVAVTGIEWPEFKERFARLRESVRLIRALWSDERVTLRGRLLHDRPGDGLRPPRARRCRSTSPPAGRRSRATPAAPATASSARAARAWSSTTEKLLPAVAEGLEKADREPDSIDRMIEIKLSYDPDPDARAREHALLGAARADRRAEGRARGPDRDAARRRRAADRAGREPLDRRLRPRRRRRAGQALRRRRASTTSSSTRRARTRSASSTRSPSRSLPGLRELSAEQVEHGGRGSTGRPGTGSSSGSSSSSPPSSGSGSQPRHSATITREHDRDVGAEQAGRRGTPGCTTPTSRSDATTAAAAGSDSAADAVSARFCSRCRLSGSSSGSRSSWSWRRSPASSARSSAGSAPRISHASPPRRSASAALHPEHHQPGQLDGERSPTAARAESRA